MVSIIPLTGQSLEGVFEEPKDELALVGTTLNPSSAIPPFPFDEIIDEGDKSRKALRNWLLNTISE